MGDTFEALSIRQNAIDGDVGSLEAPLNTTSCSMECLVSSTLLAQQFEEIYAFLSWQQDVVFNGASRDPTSSSIAFCLMAKASKVSPTLYPNMSLDVDVDANDDEDNDEENDNVASLKTKGEMIFKALHKNKIARSNFMEIMSIAIEGKCRCQNRRFSGRGSRTVRLGGW